MTTSEIFSVLVGALAGWFISQTLMIFGDEGFWHAIDMLRRYRQQIKDALDW